MIFIYFLVMALACFGSEQTLLQESKEARNAVVRLEVGSAELPAALIQLQISQDKLWDYALKKGPSDKRTAAFKASGEVMVNVLHDQSESSLDKMKTCASDMLRDLVGLEKKRRKSTGEKRLNDACGCMNKIRFFGKSKLFKSKAWADIENFTFLEMIEQLKLAMDGQKNALYLSELKFLVEVKALFSRGEKGWHEFRWFDKLYRLEDLDKIDRCQDAWLARCSRLKREDFLVDESARQEYVFCKSMLVACALLDSNHSVLNNHTAHLQDLEARRCFWEKATLGNVTKALYEIANLKAGTQYFLKDVVWRAGQLCSSKDFKNRFLSTLNELTDLKFSSGSIWSFADRVCEKFEERKRNLWILTKKDDLDRAVRASIEGRPESFEFFELCIRVRRWGTGAKNKLSEYASQYVDEFFLLEQQKDETVHVFIKRVFDDMAMLASKIKSVRDKPSAIQYIQELRNKPWDIEQAKSTNAFLFARLEGLQSQGLIEKEFIQIVEENFFKSDPQIFAEELESALSSGKYNREKVHLFLDALKANHLWRLEKDIKSIKKKRIDFDEYLKLPDGSRDSFLNRLYESAIWTKEDFLEVKGFFERLEDENRRQKALKLLDVLEQHHARPWRHQNFSVECIKCLSGSFCHILEPFSMLGADMLCHPDFVIVGMLKNYALKMKYGVKTEYGSTTLSIHVLKEKGFSPLILAGAVWEEEIVSSGLVLDAEWFVSRMCSDDFCVHRAQMLSEMCEMPIGRLMSEITKEQNFIAKCKDAGEMDKEELFHSITSFVIAKDYLNWKKTLEYN